MQVTVENCTQQQQLICRPNRFFTIQLRYEQRLVQVPQNVCSGTELYTDQKPCWILNDLLKIKHPNRIPDDFMGIQIRIWITLLIFIPDAETDFSPSRIPDPGSQIPETHCLQPRSQIRDPHKKISIYNPKKLFITSIKQDQGSSTRIPDSDTDFLPIPDPKLKNASDPGSKSSSLI